MSAVASALFRIPIPGDANPDAIDASLHGGVLTVRVPKAARDRTREIEVNGSMTGRSQR
jgi:HSP20 family protein